MSRHLMIYFILSTYDCNDFAFYTLSTFGHCLHRDKILINFNILIFHVVVLHFHCFKLVSL